jgi:hypothetical protein
VLEARLAAEAPARVFLADIGGQIHLRITASASMTDGDLLPFLETLHVPAMNADVVEKVTGLGEVPLIVLASGLAPEDHALWQAERAAEATRIAAEKEAEKEAERQKKAKADAAPETGGSTKGSTFDTLFGGLMGGGEGGGADLSESARKDTQTALIDAAKSGNAFEAGAMAGALYGAIAEELARTEMKAAPGGVAEGGGISFPSVSSSGRKSEITVGVGSCSSDGGGKFCSVTGTGKD